MESWSQVPETPVRSALREHRGDRVGLALVVAWIGWALASAAGAGEVLWLGSPYVVAPVCLVAGVLAGRAMSVLRDRSEEPIHWLLTVITLVALLVAYWPGAGGPPLGYANANAALVNVLIGLCGLALPRASGRVRTALWWALPLLAVLVVASRSRAGLLVCVPVLASVVLANLGLAPRRLFVPLAVAGPLVAAFLVVGLGTKQEWWSWAQRAFDPVRRELWHAASKAWESHPVSGVGPGNFQGLTVWGRDPDTAAAHSAVLQIGAETGWVGVTLFALLCLWAVLFFQDNAGPDAPVLAMTVAGVLMHAQVDHILDFGPILFGLGVALGWVQNRSWPARPSEGPQASDMLRGHK